MTGPRGPLPSRVRDLPPLPDAYGATLEAGLDELSLRLTPVQRAAIDGHVRLLLAWNRVINLTAIRDPEAAARLHVLDALSAVEPLREADTGRLLDLGTGGGVPGLPLAIALGVPALLVDSVAKKVRFLETAIPALAIEGVAALAARAEALAAESAHREAWPAVTARAVAPLAELVELAFPLLEPGGLLVAWKRGDLAAELRAADAATEELGGGRRRVVNPGLAALPEHRLVIVHKLGRTPPGWPRGPATRRRRPW